MSNALHPAHQFRNVVESKANDFLQSMVGTDNGAAAAGRVALAFRQAAQTNDRLYSCEPASVAQAVALSAMTGLMPGGHFLMFICSRVGGTFSGKYLTAASQNWPRGMVCDCEPRQSSKMTYSMS